MKNEESGDLAVEKARAYMDTANPIHRDEISITFTLERFAGRRRAKTSHIAKDGEKELQDAPYQDRPQPALTVPPAGNIPRITRLLALAIKMDGLLRDGIVRDYADLAGLGCVSRPRLTQVMNLLNLAPDIQEQILDLPRTVKGRDPVSEGHVRGITGEIDWERQREMWGDARAAD